MDCKLRCEDKMHSRGESSWEFGELEKVRQCQHSGRCDENMCIYSGAHTWGSSLRSHLLEKAGAQTPLVCEG